MTVMFLILLGLFLTFSAFALDLGNYYLWRLRIDKIARAAALGGVARRGLDGYQATFNDPSQQQIATAVRDSVTANFASYGITNNFSPGSPTYNFTNETLTVTVGYQLSFILIDKIGRALNYAFNTVNDDGSTVTRGSWLVSQQTATLAPSNVVLMLDVSGSMLCPSQANCACRRTNTCPDPANDPTKLTQMAQGVSRFVRMFNPARDRIAVIPFNLAAQRLFSLTTPTGGAQTMQQSISNNSTFANQNAWNFLTSQNLATRLQQLAGSNTNHCDALAEGILELENLSSTLYGASGAGTARQQLQPFVVFFSDGAPNAMRGIFDNNPGVRNCDRYAGSNYANNRNACNTFAAPASSRPDATDMYHYALEWVSVLPGPPVTTNQYRGPGPFVMRQVDNQGIPTLFNHTIGSASVAPNNSIVCGQHSANPVQFEGTITTNTNTGAGRRGAATGCLTPAGNANTFSFAIPYTNRGVTENETTGNYNARVNNVPISTADTNWRDPAWPVNFFTPPVPAYGLQKFDELPYYCAIEAADYIRTRFGATIFTIGLGAPSQAVGPANPNDPLCNDPLQDPDDHVGRKDFFLSRLAFSRQMFSDPVIPVNIPPHYSFKGALVRATVTTCQNHRFLAPTAPNVLRRYRPLLNFGTDSSTTYKDLRPLRPQWADAVAENPTDTSRRIDTQGEYFATNNPAEVPAIFSTIAKSILLRQSS